MASYNQEMAVTLVNIAPLSWGMLPGMSHDINLGSSRIIHNQHHSGVALDEWAEQMSIEERD